MIKNRFQENISQWQDEEKIRSGSGKKPKRTCHNGRERAVFESQVWPCDFLAAQIKRDVVSRTVITVGRDRGGRREEEVL